MDTVTARLVIPNHGTVDRLSQRFLEEVLMIPVRLEDVVVDEKRETYLVLLDSDLRLDGSLTVGIGPFSALNISSKLEDETEGRYDAQNLVSELLDDTAAGISRIRLHRDERGRYRARITETSPEEKSRDIYEAELAEALALAAETDARLEVPPELLQNVNPTSPAGEELTENLEAVSHLRDELEEALENENYQRAETLKPKLNSEIRKLEESEDLDENIEEELKRLYRNDTD